jgi:hypothetical protein
VDVPLGARIVRAAVVAATAWTVGALWAAWAVVHVLDWRWFRWPGWAYGPANYGLELLKDAYLPVLWMLTLVWGAWVFATIGRRRWVVAAVAVVLLATCVYHSPTVRE